LSSKELKRLKKMISELIEKDEEFRYFIASKIGLLEILKKLDGHDKKFNEIMEEIRRLREKSIEHDKKFNEILAKIAEHDKKFNEIMEEIRRLREKSIEHDKKFNEILTKIAEHDKKFNEILAKIAEHDKKFNTIIEEIASIKRDISELKSFQEKLALTTEEEAIEVIRYFLREKYNIDVSLETIYIDTRAEIDIYGVTGDICIFGEASVRLGKAKVDDLLKKFFYVKKNYPNYLKDKVILVLYGIRVLPNTIEEAEKHGIWIVTATKELTKLKIQKTKNL